MSAPSLTPVVKGLLDTWKATSAITTITGARIYQAWPQTQTIFPILVLWEGRDARVRFDQGQPIGIRYYPPIEIAGYDPNQLRDLKAAVENATPTGLTASGFSDVIVRLGQWIPRFDKERKLFQHVATIDIYAKPA